MNNMTTKLD